MSEQEIHRLELLINEIMGKLTNVSDALGDIRSHLEKENERAEKNSERITRLEEKIRTAQEDIDNNFSQHKNDFYPMKGELEKYKGMGIMLKVIFGSSIVSFIGFIITIILFFQKAS